MRCEIVSIFDTPQKLHLARTVEHFALGTQAITLGDKIVDLLSALQDTLNRLVQHNLGLVELFLDLHDAVGLLGILILGQVFLELRHAELRRPGGP